MLKSTEYAQLLRGFINEEIEDTGLKIKYKIYIRLDFSLEVRLFVGNEDGKNIEIPAYLSEDGEDELQERFEKYLKKVGKTEGLSLLKDSKSSLFIPEIRFSIDKLEEAENPLNKYMFENGHGNDIEYGAKYRLASLLDLYSNAMSRTKEKEWKVPIVTFYSYKGGMGRTTSLIAFALYLAAKGKRVAVVDCDLEAPGYLNFFDLSNQVELREGRRNGVVEYLSDYTFVEGEDNYLNISKYVVIPAKDSQGGVGADYFQNIYIVPGGNLNEPIMRVDAKDPDYLDELNRLKESRKDYLEGISRLNLSNVTNMKQGFASLFSKLYRDYEVDVILLDSRTGLNDIFGVLALNMSDYVIGFFGFSDQTIPGVRQLMQAYALPQTNFDLALVTSLLPLEAKMNWIESGRKKISKIVEEELENSSKEAPEHFMFKRVSSLELLGTGDSDSDAKLFTLVEGLTKEGKENSCTEMGEMKELFDAVIGNVGLNQRNKLTVESVNVRSPKDEDFGLKGDVAEQKLTSIQRQKFILKHVMSQMSKIKLFAEDTTIEPSLFFYRKCMAEFFHPSKFIILGSKGSGKSMLYKALGDPNLKAIQDLILYCVKKTIELFSLPFELSNEDRYIYLNAISLDKKDFSFNDLFNELFVDSNQKSLNIFWMIYTWNMILSDARFKYIKENSKIGDKVIESKGFDALDGMRSLVRKEDFSFLAMIERDFEEINRFLMKNNEKLLILYDGLDNIDPRTWSKTVSPLIDFWRDRAKSYSNISPKLFIRTDLFAYVQGTNTLRLKEATINIDWSLEEVFGFFFKLVLSNNEVKNQMWEIFKVLGKKGHIRTIENNWDSEAKQMLNPNQAVLTPLVNIFFGKMQGNEKSTWKFFEKNLSNASGAISLRPFINLLGSDVLMAAYTDSNTYIQAILDPKFYDTQMNRDKAANEYFNDMAQGDDYTSDILKFKDYLTGPKGEQYRYQELEEEDFEKLLEGVYNVNKDSLISENISQLRNQLIAAGVVAVIPRRYKIYKFAPMFYYSWGLKSSDKWERGTLCEGRTGKFVILTNDGHRISFKRVEDCPENPYPGMVVEYKKEEVNSGDYKISACRVIKKSM